MLVLALRTHWVSLAISSDVNGIALPVAYTSSAYGAV
jgi:hypothetical protein